MQLKDRVAEILVGAALHSMILLLLEALVAGGVVTLVGIGVAHLTNFDAGSELLLVLLAAAVAFVGTVALLASARAKRVILNVPTSEWVFDSRKISIDYSNFEKPTYRRTYVVRSNRDGLERITDSFCWTGKGCSLPVCAKGSCSIREIGHAGLFTLFEVAFPARLNKGKLKEIELVWNLDNEGKSAKPFISTTISHKTTKIEFEVVLPAGTYNGPAYYTISPHIHTQFSNEIEEIAFTGNRVDVLRHESPRMFSHHEVRWEWL